VILLATLTTLIPYAYAAVAQLVLLATDRAAFSGRRLVKDAVIALLAFAYSLWAVAGSGYEVVFKGTLLILGGMPLYAWLKYRAVRTESVAGSAPEPPAQAA